MLEEKTPTSWKMVKLGDLAEVKGRIGWRGLKKAEYTKEGPILLSIGNITETGIDFQNVDHLTWDRYHESPEITLAPKDIIMGKDGTLGKVAFVDSIPYETTISSTLAKIRVTSTLIEPRYLFYYFKSEIFQLQVIGSRTGSTVGHFVQKNIKSAEVPVPPVEKQKVIINVLDLASSLVQKREKANQIANKILQSTFLQMFGDPIKNPKHWNIRKLGDVCTSIKDGPHVSPNYVEKGVPFISVHNIINGFFDLSDIKYISRENHERFCKRTKPEKGDVLYSKGGTTGYAKRIDVDFEFSIWVHLALLKFSKELLDPIFLETCLNSSYCRAQAKSLTRGIANKDLVLSQMAEVRIIVPPIDLQRRFSTIVGRIEHLRSYQRQTASEVDELFNALMQKAFKGELVTKVN